MNRAAIEKALFRIKRSLTHVIGQTKFFQRWRLLEKQNQFLLFELCRANRQRRYQLLGDNNILEDDVLQTQSSFDYQWHEFATGHAMADDQEFMSQIGSLICKMTRLPEAWFSGKKVVDIGCGVGRFTYGFLSLGAVVTACDHSPWALERTVKLCESYGKRLATQQVDLLKWHEKDEYDLAFCFGVVHHTGNTYLAIRNASRKVRPGGRLFLMVYGFPETLADFCEVNTYEKLREELRDYPFEEKKRILIERFGPHQAHGWFDAISPRINDLLTFDEVRDLLTRLRFENITRTMDSRNHHVVADKRT